MGLFQSVGAFLEDAAGGVKAMIGEREVPLTPNVGGFCAAPASLRKADIIVSTTRSVSSLGIRLATGSVVSHAALYTGTEVVEAVTGQGVRLVSLEKALSDDALAVVYRHPGMTAEKAGRITAWAVKAATDKARYDYAGAATSALPTFACRLNTSKQASFFCSELVFEAYRQGGLPLSSLPSACVTPDTLVEVSVQALVYAGHLVGNPSWFPALSP